MTDKRAAGWLDLGRPVGSEQRYRRPAVIISSDELNSGPSRLVIVVPVTSRRRGVPGHVQLAASRRTGLKQTSWAKPEDILSTSRLRLDEYLGDVGDEAVEEIVKGVTRLLEA